jgi:hypothetical protein
LTRLSLHTAGAAAAAAAAAFPPLLQLIKPDFCNFGEARPAHCCCCYCCIFLLLQLIKPDFSNFDEAGAWPYLMDEFVDFMKKRNGMAVDS